MKTFFSVIFGLITLMLMVFGICCSVNGDFSSRGGHGDVNIGGTLAMLGVIGITLGIFTGLITLAILFSRKSSKENPELTGEDNNTQVTNKDL